MITTRIVSKLLLLLSYSLCFSSTTIKPVIIIHGLLSNNLTMIHLSDAIKMLKPGTNVHIIDEYQNWDSLRPMKEQAITVGEHVMEICAANPEGVNLIGYSQGGLVSRAILEYFPFHNVKTFISLSAPQGGQYGSNMIHQFFPHLTRRDVYKLFYTPIGQEISIANYWNDPHHQEQYYKHCHFLPNLNNYSNNLTLVVLRHNDTRYKQGIMKLNKFVAIGGPDDGIIEPWQSSQFGYFDQSENVVELMDQEMYKNDLIGLRSLNEEGKLVMLSVNGVSHHLWYKNLSVISMYILPYLN